MNRSAKTLSIVIEKKIIDEIFSIENYIKINYNNLLRWSIVNISPANITVSLTYIDY